MIITILVLKKIYSTNVFNQSLVHLFVFIFYVVIIEYLIELLLFNVYKC